SSAVTRTAADRDHEFRFTLPMEVSDAQIKVTNADGEVQKTYDLKNLKTGENKITWNGQDDKGNKLPPGEYKFSIEAKAGEKKVAVKTEFAGTITGINYTPEGPVLMVGSQTIKMRDVRKITDPSLLSNDQKVKDVTGQDLPKTPEQLKTITEGNKETAKPAPSVAKGNIMDNVGLSREMMDKLAKEMK
ncbi:MAG: flagellar biosynthesis protein FlgD, partial [Proteobacteria bacterium]